ncbi:hypothetical protein ACEPAG_3733 [Sanghuangporus baumii]
MPVHHHVDRFGESRYIDLEHFIHMAKDLRDGKLFRTDIFGQLQHFDDTADDFEKQVRFAKFVVTGVHPDDKKQTYIVLNSYAANNVEGIWRIYQDYDSFFGISRTLPYRAALQIHVMPEPRDTLTQGVHMNHPVEFNGRNISVPLTQIPNFGFASCASRHLIRLFMPGLYQPPAERGTRSVHFQENVAKLVYNKITLPALQEVVPHRVGHYPASYEAELRRATRRNGVLVRTKYDLPARTIGNFLRAFMRIIADYQINGEEAIRRTVRSAFFMHEVKGVKGREHREIASDITAEEILERVAEIFNLDELRDEIAQDQFEMWVDVGFEAGIDGYVGLVRRDAHSSIVSYFTSLDYDAAQRQIKKKSDCYIDEAAHLTDAAGLRLGLPVRTHQHVSYLNIYNVEKEPTFLKDWAHYAKFILSTDILNAREKNERAIPGMEGILKIFNEAIKVNYFPSRFEARVPLDCAADMTLLEETVRDWMFLIPRHIWWIFKSFRLQALTHLAEWILRSPRKEVLDPEVLTLIAAITYMNNGLCARPEEGDRWDSLKWAILRHDHDDNLQQEVALCPFGLFFIRSIDFNGCCPHLGQGRVCFTEDLARLFGQKSYSDVLNLVSTALSIEPPRPAIHPEARTNKQTKTSGVDVDDEDPIFDVESLGIVLPPMKGTTVREVTDHAIEGYDQYEHTSNFTASKIWKLFFANMGEKFWVRRQKSEEPYVKMPDGPVTESFFKEIDLANCFNCIGFRTSTRDAWDSCFNNLFLDTLTLPPNRKGCQNYYQMEFYNIYLEIRESMVSAGHDERLMFGKYRAELRRRFDELVWVPFAEKNRLITSSVSKRNNGPKDVWPRNHTDAAPVIVVNWRRNNEVQDILDSVPREAGSSRRGTDIEIIEIDSD